MSETGIWSIKIPAVKCVFTEELWDVVPETFFFVSFFYNFKYLHLLVRRI